MRLLVVEDELELARQLVRFLRREGWVCDHAPTLAHAEVLLDDFRYGAILLDRRLRTATALPPACGGASKGATLPC